jgi:hypothetical protein
MASKFPFDSRSGDRLVALLQLDSREELIEQCRVVNLLDSWPGRDGKGDRFPAETAKSAADELRADRPIVLMCGRSVGAACGVHRDYFEPCTWRGGVAVVIPHPSGISHWWNDADNRQLAARFFTDILSRGLKPDTWPRFNPEKLKRMIAQRNTTQKKLAGGINRDEHTVGRWARGVTKPDVDDFYAIMWFLACDAADLAD